MYKKHVLILGAGLMQGPAIESAKSLGWHVSVVDGNSEAVCKHLADEFRHIDLKDIDGLAEYALKIKKEHGLDAVFTAGTDFSASVAYVAEKTGLCGHSYDAACNATDKVRMRSCFEKKGALSPKSVEFTSEKCKKIKEQGEQFIPTYIPFFTEFPLVIKPVDNMGARGCRMANTFDELIEAVKTAIYYSKTGRAIVEQYMDGPEFSVDALVCNGKIIVCGFADRHIYYPPYFIEMGHTMSTDLENKKKVDLLKAFQDAVFSLGLTHGAAKGDIKLTSNGPMIGEVAARLSGGYMSGWTFPYASQINLTKEALLLSAGEKSELFDAVEQHQQDASFTFNGSSVLTKKINDSLFLLEPAYASAERAYVSIPGVVSKVSGMNKAQTTLNVKNIFTRSQIGDCVQFPVNNVEKCGNIISQAATRADAALAAESALQNIVIHLQVPNSQTEEFLSQDTEFPPSAYIISEQDKQVLNALQENIDFSRPLFEQIPACLRKYELQTDWNRKSLLLSIDQIERHIPKNSSIRASVFWMAIIRGGVQGALYAVEKRLL